MGGSVVGVRAGRSRTLDDICALAVVAARADVAVVTLVCGGMHHVMGASGTGAEVFSFPALSAGNGSEEWHGPEAALLAEPLAAGIGAVLCVPVAAGEAQRGMLLLARRGEEAFAPDERAILHRLRLLAEAQIGAETVMGGIARGALGLIEGWRR